MLLVKEKDSNSSDNSRYSSKLKTYKRLLIHNTNSFVSNIQSVGIFRSAWNVLIKASNLVKTCTALDFTRTLDPSLDCQQFLVREFVGTQHIQAFFLLLVG